METAASQHGNGNSSPYAGMHPHEAMEAFVAKHMGPTRYYPDLPCFFKLINLDHLQVHLQGIHRKYGDTGHNTHPALTAEEQKCDHPYKYIKQGQWRQHIREEICCKDFSVDITKIGIIFYDKNTTTIRFAETIYGPSVMHDCDQLVETFAEHVTGSSRAVFEIILDVSDKVKNEGGGLPPGLERFLSLDEDGDIDLDGPGWASCRQTTDAETEEEEFDPEESDQVDGEDFADCTHGDEEGLGDYLYPRR